MIPARPPASSPTRTRWRWRLEGAALAAAGLMLGWVALQGTRSLGHAATAAWADARRVPAVWASITGPRGGAAPGETLDPLEWAVTNAPESELSATLLHAEDRFLALAAHVESFRANAYRDNAGWNIGFGYCIARRQGANGGALVREDLAVAGLSPADIEILLSGPDAARRRVAMTPLGAVRLLQRLSVEYHTAARRSIGPAFDALPTHRQAALAWLAYNTGATGFSEFRRLHRAVQQQDTEAALAQLTPWFRGNDGKVRPNRRAGAMLRTAYQAPEGIVEVVRGGAVTAMPAAPR